MKTDMFELLAPAGSMEAFAAAVDGGADAVYIGAPGANARALARDFRPVEIAAMIDYAHHRGVRVYAAMNSLLKEEELAAAAATVEMLAGLGIDALIIQDLGLHEICRRFFPDLRLHASTLMGGHNSLAVQQFAAMGFSRVVLARELTIKEIAAIRRQSEAELEVFVHGAMCFSYSGLCLFSSYLGGKSSLRGRCVQPCRRAYRWQNEMKGRGKPAYLFSMNDLEALELLPELRRAGVGSVKIEGRMKSALYVDRVVRAYRLVIDAMADNGDQPGQIGRFQEALAEGRALLAQAMGRRTGAGYLREPFRDLVTPGQSGNIGHFLGKISGGRGTLGVLTLRHSLRQGDRLRLHREPGGERTAFTVKEIWSAARGRKGGGERKSLTEAAAGSEVEIGLPVAARSGDSLYKVDLAQRRRQAARCELVVTQQHRRQAAAWENQPLRREIKTFIGSFSVGGDIGKKRRRGEKGPSRPGGEGDHTLPLWLRLDDPQLLLQRLPPQVAQVVLPLSPASWPQLAASGKAWRKLGSRLVWALPPVILEDDLPFYREKIAELQAQGSNTWQLGHLGQLLLFGQAAEPAPATHAARGGKKTNLRRTSPVLYGDYTLNILNSLARQSCRRLGIKAVQAAIETDRSNLLAMLNVRRPGESGKKSKTGPGTPISLGLTIHGRPPLFTSRLDSVHFRYQATFRSPREEKFILVREHDLTLALAGQPFSLLSRAGELAEAGLAYGVVDLRRQKLSRQDLLPLLRRAGKSAQRRREPDTFNFMGGLD